VPTSSPLSCCVSKDVSPDISDLIRFSISFISAELAAASLLCEHDEAPSLDVACHSEPVICCNNGSTYATLALIIAIIFVKSSIKRLTNSNWYKKRCIRCEIKLNETSLYDILTTKSFSVTELFFLLWPIMCLVGC